MRGVNHFINEERKHKYNSIAKVKAALKGEKDHDKIIDFIKKEYDLNNSDHADIVADIVAYYKIAPEDYFDEDGNLLEAKAARNYIGQDFSQGTEYGIEFQDGVVLNGKVIHFGDSENVDSNWMSHFRPYYKNSNFKRDDKSTVIDYMNDGVEYMVIEITTPGHKPKYYFLSDVDVKLFELPKAPKTSFPLPSGAIFDMSGDTVLLKQGSTDIELGPKDIKKLETLIKKAKRKYKIK